MKKMEVIDLTSPSPIETNNNNKSNDDGSTTLRAVKRKEARRTKNRSTIPIKKIKTMEMIDITSPSPIETNNNTNNDDGSTPLKAVFSLKVKGDMKETEEKEDCFILDFDNPTDDHVVVNSDMGGDGDDDLTVVSEKGQVACRDYPHARHLCVKYQFDQTSHDTYCQLCYCYVCDKAAPCSVWSTHCHAVENKAWKYMRDATTKENI